MGKPLSMVRRLLVLVVVPLLLIAVAAAPAGAAAVYGGGSASSNPNDAVPLFLVTVDHARASILGRSGGPCTDGHTALGHFQTHRFRIRGGGRFHIGGSFDFRIPGASAKVVYRIRGRVRARSGVVTGVASVRASFPNATTGKTIICASSRRAFRARSPVSRAPRHSRGPFYGVTSQGLPIVIRLAPDGSALAPAALWATLTCNIAGPVEATPRLRVPATAPGVFAVATPLSQSFIPALGSNTPIPAGTYTYDPLGVQAQVGGGRATGSIGISARVGNAGRILVDTCSAPPIAFTALP